MRFAKLNPFFMTAISLTFLSACGDVKSVLKGNSDRDSNDGRAVQAAQEMGEFSLTPPPLPPDHPAEFLAVRLLPLKGGKSFEARFAYRGGEPIRIPNLPTGLYEVSVELLGRQGAVIEKGMNRVEIRAGQVATTEIVLRPTGADGAGGLVVVVKRPGDGPEPGNFIETCKVARPAIACAQVLPNTQCSVTIGKQVVTAVSSCAVLAPYALLDKLCASGIPRITLEQHKSMKCGPEPTTPDPLPPVVTPVTGPVLKLLPPGREHIRVEKRTIGQSGNVTTVAYAYVPALSQVTVEVTVVGQDPGKGQGRIVKLERAQQEKLDLLLGEIQGTVFKDKPEVACVAALLPGTVTRKLAAIYPREGEMNFVDDLCALTPTSRGQLEIKSFDASFQAIEALLK